MEYKELPTINHEMCQDCGACCMRMGIPPFFSYDDDDYDFLLLPNKLKRELEAAFDRLIGPAKVRIPSSTGQPCIWLDRKTLGCRHYEQRPFCCREFQPGSEVCLDERALQGIDDSAKTS